MSEIDVIIERNNIGRLCKDLSLKQEKEVINLISELKDTLKSINLSIDTITLLVFLYRKGLIGSLTEDKGENINGS